MRNTDVLIVGAGPAGSACAIGLQKAGHECLLIDRAAFPRDKLCGGGLTPKAWRLLEEICPTLHYDYLPVGWMQLYMQGRYVGRYALNDEIRVVVRKEFDDLLLQEYRRLGGRFEQHALEHIEETADGRIIVTLHDGETIGCRYLVGADGALSRVRRHLCPETQRGILILEQYCQRQHDDIVIELSPEYKEGYCYIFPNSKVDTVGYCATNTSIDNWKRSKLTAEASPEGRLRGAIISTVIDYPFHDRILLVGDAGCWCDTLSYEGLYYALATGQAASQAVLTGKRFAEVTRHIAKKKRHHNLAAKILYNRPVLCLVGVIGRHQHLTERILNRYMR